MIQWLRRVFGTHRLDIELDKELRFHVDARTDDLIRDGHARGEARRLALAEFGGIEPIREASRDARGARWLVDLFQDFRYARRVLWSNKAFTAAAILSLGLGLGANAAVFRVMDSLMFRSLDVPHPDQLFYIESARAEESRFSHPAYLQLAAAVPETSLAVATPITTMQVTVDGVAQLTSAQLVSGHWFDMLGVTPARGRLLARDDERTDGGEAVAVMSDRLWSRMFARNPGIVGSTLMVNGAAVTIVGITPPGFGGVVVASPVGLWLPVTAQPLVRHRNNVQSDNADEGAPWVPQDGISWLMVFGRMPASLDRDTVQRNLAARYAQVLETRHAAIADDSRRGRLTDDRLVFQDGSLGLSGSRTRLGPALQILIGMSGLVLIVACANLANLLLARGIARHREFALRLAIGARRGRLVRQLLVESLTLAALGGALGLVFALWGSPFLLRVVSSTATPVPLDLPLDWRVLGVGITATLLTGVAFGLVPALRLSRPDVGDALKLGGRVINGTRRRRPFPLAKVLVSAQVALSFVLVAGAALFTQSFSGLVALDPGYDRETVINARFDTRLARFEPDELPALYERLLAEVSRVPGVTSVTLGVVGPATGSIRSSTIQVEGYDPPPDVEPFVHEDSIGPDYVHTLGMRLVAGRAFDGRDREGGERTVIVNETMARRYLGSGDPIGRRFSYGGDAPKYTIVGVVADARALGQRADIAPMAYYPLSQHPREYVRNLYVRTSLRPDAMVEPVTKAMQQAAPALALREVVTLAELSERTVATERMVSRLATAFGALGAIVAMLGLYGAIAYSVARRTNEIGVRLALGAAPSGVRWLVLRETMLVVAVGLIAGIALAFPAGAVADSLLFGMSFHDGRTLALASVAVAFTGAAVGAIPAWRASRVNPTTALRE
jgi:predicted permease